MTDFKIKKVIVPIAGKGTRFLPATKQVPKEILPLLDKPMIHYIMDEIKNSGIEEVILVTGAGKSIVEDYFDRNLHLEHFLRERGKNTLADEMRRIGEMVSVVSVRQKEPLGLGHAILSAEYLVENQPFAVCLPDDLVDGDPPCLAQLIKVFQSAKNLPYNPKNTAAVIGVMEVAAQDVHKYGIVEGPPVSELDRTYQMSKMLEKPHADQTMSRLACPGRYVFHPLIFSYLHKIPRGASGEYQLTDAIDLMARDHLVLAHQFEGKRFDTGQLEGMLDASIHFALQRTDLKQTAEKIILKYAKKVTL